MTTIAQSDPWLPHDNPGKGKGNPHIVPESSVYGVGLMAIILILIMLKRRLKTL
jgi:hypothetical protein